jgi:protein-tyrosine-phosphatase
VDIDAQDIEPAVQREIARLVEEFQGIFSPESIDRLARDSFERLEGAPVKRFLPQFVYRFTRERLQALATVEGLIKRGHLDILFVCGRNAARSQMAAALTQSLSHGRFTVHSAGARPVEQVDPAVVAVMAELRLDLSEAFPKPLTDEVVQVADVVITMGCGDACPLLPFKKYEDWPIPDPHGKAVVTVREIRDVIRGRVEGLIATLEALRVQ